MYRVYSLSQSENRKQGNMGREGRGRLFNRKEFFVK
jgi:hypothetical protein